MRHTRHFFGHRITGNLCECCILGGSASHKARKIKAEQPSVNMVLGQVLMDMHGPYSIKSMGGHTYVQVFMDGKSRYTWCRLMTSKTETVTALKEFIAEVGTPHKATH